jgi:hypothetical protein
LVLFELLLGEFLGEFKRRLLLLSFGEVPSTSRECAELASALGLCGE